MTTPVFYSFHFDRDFWRVQQVRNIGALDATKPVSAQDWESVKKGGDAAIEKWIAGQMEGKSAAVVLVGAETASRRWVRYEIAHAWDNHIPLVGVRIHGLKDSSESIDSAGADPFGAVPLKSGRNVADYVELHNPAGRTSQEAHASVTENMETWVANAYKQS